MEISPRPSLVVCIRNDGFLASLEVRKIYEVIPDDSVAAHHCLRVIDESGEDYIYPEDFFLAIELPEPVKEALLLAG
jgi:hypothetical protein